MISLSRNIAVWPRVQARTPVHIATTAAQSRFCAPSSSTAEQQQHQPWVVHTSNPNFENLAAESVLKHGFVILPKLFDQESLSKLKTPIIEHADKVMGMIKHKDASLQVGSSNGFHEICLRSPGRIDIPCDPSYLDDSVVSHLQTIANNLLGGSDSLNTERVAVEETAPCAYAGLVRAEPGCTAQLWHADSPHVSGPRHGPPNMLNMLVSVNNLPIEMGPTEVVPGSHVLTNHLRPDAHFGEHTLVYQQQENSPELIGATAAPVIAEMAAGSVLIFDDRVLHRGRSNQAAADRDLVFLSYRRSSYSTPTYYEAQRSLSKYDHKSLAETVRKEFPGLKRCGNWGGSSGGNTYPDQVILADGASGSQFHKSVIDGMVDQMTNGIANMGGNYDHSRCAEDTMIGMRAAMGDFLNCTSEEIVFGPSMSALTYHVVRALKNSKTLSPGGNIVLDPASHGANVWTWVQLAKALDIEVRWLSIGDGLVLDSHRSHLSKLIDEKTRFLAVGYASNGTGSVHDVKGICEAAKTLSNGNAICYVDAVHYAPHGQVDVQEIGCDFLVCSPYKFFGPHSGILFGRSQLLKTLSVDRLDCQDDGLPNNDNCNMSRWEIGTQNYEAAAGVLSAVNYLAGLGDRFGGADAGSSRATRLACAWRAIGAHESEIKACFLEGVSKIKGLHVVGVTDPALEMKRTATFAVAKDGLTAEQLTNSLCEQNIWCTYGNHYASYWSEHSGGLAQNDTGITRLGFLHYNTIDEIQKVVRVLADV